MVVDPNVIVSALIAPAGPPGQIIKAWEERGAFDLVVSELLLQELESVLTRAKFHRFFTPEEARIRVQGLRERAMMAEEGEILPVTPDPKDDYLLSLARASGADHLVSGDGRHLLGLALTNDYPPVVTPKAFLEMLQNK